MDADPGYCYNQNSLKVNKELSQFYLYNKQSINTISMPNNAQWWYYFDAENGVCSKFLFHGCSAGNKNRFYSLYQCRFVCGNRLTPQIGKSFIINSTYVLYI